MPIHAGDAMSPVSRTNTKRPSPATTKPCSGYRPRTGPIARRLDDLAHQLKASTLAGTPHRPGQHGGLPPPSQHPAGQQQGIQHRLPLRITQYQYTKAIWMVGTLATCGASARMRIRCSSGSPNRGRCPMRRKPKRSCMAGTSALPARVSHHSRCSPRDSKTCCRASDSMSAHRAKRPSSGAWSVR